MSKSQKVKFNHAEANHLLCKLHEVQRTIFYSLTALQTSG